MYEALIKLQAKQNVDATNIIINYTYLSLLVYETHVKYNFNV